jgi:hypothetical protein
MNNSNKLSFIIPKDTEDKALLVCTNLSMNTETNHKLPSDTSDTSIIEKPKRGRPVKYTKDDPNVVTINGKRKFKCLKCQTTYSRKCDLIKHYKSPQKCENEQIYQKAAQAALLQQSNTK